MNGFGSQKAERYGVNGEEVMESHRRNRHIRRTWARGDAGLLFGRHVERDLARDPRLHCQGQSGIGTAANGAVRWSVSSPCEAPATRGTSAKTCSYLRSDSGRLVPYLVIYLADNQPIEIRGRRAWRPTDTEGSQSPPGVFLACTHAGRQFLEDLGDEGLGVAEQHQGLSM